MSTLFQLHLRISRMNHNSGTVVRLPQRQLARAAVELLMDVLESRVTTWQTRILECELHVGISSGPPPR